MNEKSSIRYKNITYATIIFASLFFSIGCSILSDYIDDDANDDTNTVIDNTKAIIVTVDGLSFANTLLGTNIEKSNDYLQTNLKNIINSELIRPFHWNGNAGDTAAILASSDIGLRKFLIDNYNEAKVKNKAFIVVSHSWGTFLSYLALSLEPQIECDLFITMSSPLGTASGLPNGSFEKIVRDYTDGKLSAMSFNILGPSYPHVKVFYNFLANGDLISGPLTGKIPGTPNVQDIMVDEGISDNRNIEDCYFWHKFTTLGNEVVNSSDPNHLVYTAYLATILPFPYDINPIRNAFIKQVVDLIQTASSSY
jgi:hypothetical protein